MRNDHRTAALPLQTVKLEGTDAVGLLLFQLLIGSMQAYAAKLSEVKDLEGAAVLQRCTNELAKFLEGRVRRIQALQKPLVSE
jgi:SNF family Na+-dependent transporter